MDEGVPPLIVGLLLLGAAPIFALGYALAWNRRDNGDLKGTKAKIPGLRKAYWSSLWTLIKRTVLIGGVVLLLLTWVVQNAQRDSRLRPAPMESKK